MGIAEFESVLRMMLALLPVNPTAEGGVDGNWEEVILRLPEVIATTLNLLPSAYQERALQAVRDRLMEY